MHEPVKYKLNPEGTQLLVDCNGGPDNMPVNFAAKGKSLELVVAQKQLFEMLKAERDREAPPEAIPQPERTAESEPAMTPDAQSGTTAATADTKSEPADITNLKRQDLIGIILNEDLNITLPLPVGITNDELRAQIETERKGKARCMAAGIPYPTMPEEAI